MLNLYAMEGEVNLLRKDINLRIICGNYIQEKLRKLWIDWLFQKNT